MSQDIEDNDDNDNSEYDFNPHADAVDRKEYLFALGAAGILSTALLSGLYSLVTAKYVSTLMTILGGMLFGVFLVLLVLTITTVIVIHDLRQKTLEYMSQKDPDPDY